MKDFALELKDCSKADRKKVIKAHSSIGGVWYNTARFKDRSYNFLFFDMSKCNDRTYTSSISHGRIVFQMPRDWNKIQEALGINVEVEVDINDITFELSVATSITQEDAKKLIDNANRGINVFGKQNDELNHLKKVNEKLEKSVRCLENLAQSQADENIELIRENQKYQKLQEKYTKAKDIITELLA